MTSNAILFRRAYEEIEKSSIVAIGVHANPDGDAIGSMLALGEAISAPGREVIMYSHDPIPEIFSFLPNVKEICNVLSWYPDLVIGLDYGDVRRLNIPEEYTQGARMVTFDHHPEDRQRGDIRIIDTSYSSTAELLHSFFRDRNISITPTIALCLLTGIFTDTGGFIHTNAQERTHRAIGDLILHGGNINAIREQALTDDSLATLRYLGELIGRMQIDAKYKMAYVGVSYEDFVTRGGAADDLSGVVGLLNASEETLFSVFLVEYDKGKVKGSIRTEPWTNIDVSGIAKILGGGGHTCAAGFSIEGNLENAEKCLNETLSQFFGR